MMVKRRMRPALELASDVGSKAFDLYAYGDLEAEKALRVLVAVNPELFGWLRDRLNAVCVPEQFQEG